MIMRGHGLQGCTETSKQKHWNENSAQNGSEQHFVNQISNHPEPKSRERTIGGRKPVRRDRCGGYWQGPVRRGNGGCSGGSWSGGAADLAEGGTCGKVAAA